MIQAIPVRPAGSLGSRAVLEVEGRSRAGVEGAVIVAQGGTPLGWFDWAKHGGEAAVLLSRAAAEIGGATGPLRAWVPSASLVAETRGQWPIGAELWASIDSIGLAGESVWIDAGTNDGVRVGDCWWRRVAGQPVARYDVRLVADDVCYCRVVPLVAGLRSVAGRRVCAWPTPGERRAGRGATAVSFVQDDSEQQLVWIAAPVGLVTPETPAIDFYRGGRYVGSGVVERIDWRFWYVRTLSIVGGEGIRTGDDARVRTSDDIRARRFSARVFDQTPAGYLINAGETDGLSVGETATAYRDGRPVGRARLLRVQRGYSVVRPLGAEHAPTGSPVGGAKTDSSESSVELRLLDELRFAPLEEPAAVVAVVEQVVDGTLLSVRIADDAAARTCVPLALRRSGRVIGVGILLEVVGERAIGFAPARSLSEPPAVGDELAAPSCSASGDSLIDDRQSGAPNAMREADSPL